MDATFKGKVFQLETLKNEGEADSSLKEVVTAFRHYWIHGFHPDIGRDVVTRRPNPPDGHRHVHIAPLNDEPNNKRWKNWATKDMPDKNFLAANANTNKIPTSDRMLFYFVDKDRNAYIFLYKATNGHLYMDTDQFAQIVIKVGEMLDNGGITEMDALEQRSLFEEHWIESAPN